MNKVIKSAKINKVIKVKKTQITIDPVLEKVISEVIEQYPIYTVNDAIKFLLAQGVKQYMTQYNLSEQDIADIEQAEDDIINGKTVSFGPGEKFDLEKLDEKFAKKDL